MHLLLKSISANLRISDRSDLMVLVATALLLFNLCIYAKRNSELSDNNSVNNTHYYVEDKGIDLANKDELLLNPIPVVSNSIDIKDSVVGIDNNVNKSAVVINSQQSLLKPQIKNNTKSYSLYLNNGDTLYSLLIRVGLSNSNAHLVAKSVDKVFKVTSLRVGQKIIVILPNENNVANSKYFSNTLKVKSINLLIEKKLIRVVLNDNGKSYHSVIENISDNNFLDSLIINNDKKSIYKANAVVKAKNSKSPTISTVNKSTKIVQSNPKQRLIAGRVKSSFINSAKLSGIPSDIVSSFMQLLSYDIDFQRDLSSNSQFKVLYDNDGKGKDHKIIYAYLSTNKGKIIEIYRYKNNDGTLNYYNKDGSSIKKSLLKTPIKSPVISSGFGMRHHPVLGYSRMHRGLDYKAPKGTPVLAAAEGIVETLQNHYSYGKYIKIKHNNTYTTLYAHLDKFHKNLTIGTKIKQGDIIGYVGTSGLSTSPHLHYELHKDGKQINPAKASSITTKAVLSGQQVLAFNQHKSFVNKLLENHSIGNSGYFIADNGSALCSKSLKKSKTKREQDCVKSG